MIQLVQHRKLIHRGYHVAELATLVPAITESSSIMALLLIVFATFVVIAALLPVE